MRSFGIVTGLVALAFQAWTQVPAGPAPSSIEGMIVDQSTNRSVSDVRLTIEEAASKALAGAETSGDNGNFAFRNLKPGTYRITTNKDGYAPAMPEGRRAPTSGIVFSVAPGQLLKDVVVRLLPQGVITGSVLDTNGSPVVGARVGAVSSLPFYDEFGERAFAPAGRTSLGTDDRGEFRIWALPPGDYQIRVFGTEGASALSFARYTLYYPSGPAISRAQSIPLRGGEELALPPIYAPVIETAPVRINIITDAPNLPGQTRTMQFTPKGVPPNVTVSTTNMANGGPGAIEHQGLPFGANEVRVALDTPQGVVYGETIVNVGESAEKLRVNLILKKGFRLAARVLLEKADGTLQPVPGVGVRLISYPNSVINLGGQSDAEGAVIVASAPESEYRLRLFGIPPDLYIARATQDGRDIQSRKIAVTTDTRVEIILKSGGCTITGVVTDSGGKAISNSLVALVPAESSMRGHHDLYRSATSDQDGTYTLLNVVPGDYKLFAWIEAAGAGPFRNAEFMAIYEARGKRIQISEDRNAAADLQPVDEEQ